MNGVRVSGDGDEEVTVSDLLRDRADQRVTNTEGYPVIADIEPLLLQVLNEYEYKLLIFVCVADKGGGHARSLEVLP